MYTGNREEWRTDICDTMNMLSERSQKQDISQGEGSEGGKRVMTKGKRFLYGVMRMLPN